MHISSPVIVEGTFQIIVKDGIVIVILQHILINGKTEVKMPKEN